MSGCVMRMIRVIRRSVGSSLSQNRWVSGALVL
jgi:hypothetical protein